jgi:hypothetical protein
VPSVEIKKSYPDIFYSPLSITKQSFKVPAPISPVPVTLEKSLVRPAYSKIERVVISDNAMTLIVLNCVNEYNHQFVVQKMTVSDGKTGYIIAITIDIPEETQLEKNILQLQRYITDNIERFTGIFIEDVVIVIDKKI